MEIRYQSGILINVHLERKLKPKIRYVLSLIICKDTTYNAQCTCTVAIYCIFHVIMYIYVYIFLCVFVCICVPIALNAGSNPVFHQFSCVRPLQVGTIPVPPRPGVLNNTLCMD